MIGFPKPRPRALDKQDRKAAIDAMDKSENAKVKIRSGGRCEGVIVGEGRCTRRAFSVHHMISGIGVRGRGVSALQKHKQAVCDGPHGHHRLITGHVLKLIQHRPLPWFDDPYERVK